MLPRRRSSRSSHSTRIQSLTPRHSAASKYGLRLVSNGVMQLRTTVRASPGRSAASSSGLAGTGMRVPSSRPGRKAAGGYIPFIVGDRTSSALAT